MAPQQKPKPSSLRASLSSLSSHVYRVVVASFYAILTLWRLTLRWLNSYLLYFEYGGKASTDFYHKGILIGDGLAQGFGSWVSLFAASGPMKYMNEGVLRLRPAVKMEWVFFERGALHSTTEDWLPPGVVPAATASSSGGGGGASEGKEEGEEGETTTLTTYTQTKKQKTLLKDVLTSRSGRDVCFVILLMGLQDVMKIKDKETLFEMAAWTEVEKEKKEDNDSSKPSKKKKPKASPVVKNIRAIVDYLLAQDKGPYKLHICLCTLPAVGAPSSLRAKAIAGVNAQLRRLVQVVLSEEARARVTLVDLSQRRVSRAEGRSFDGVHFNSSGYKALADAVLDEISAPLAKHEWSVLQDYVSGRKQRPVAKSWWGGGAGGKAKLN